MMKFKNEKGLSVLGMFLVLIIVALISILVIRVIPVYAEYRSIARVAKYAAEGVDEGDIRRRYDQQIRLESVYDPSVNGKDLKIEMVAGGAQVSFAYEREIELFGPASLLFKMDGSEGAKRY